VVIELSRNFGKEAALTAGMEASRGDAVVPLDADLQDPPSLIEQMVAEWRKGADVVLARRTDRSADSLLKRKTAEAFYRIHNSLSDVKVPENVGDFRLMDRRVVDALERLPERQRFMKGLFAWVGYRAVTLDYSRGVRAVGKSKFSGWKLWNFALEGITSFSTAPLKIWTYIGGAGAIAAVVYACVIVIRTMLFGVDVPGYASMLVLILFFGSLQLVSVGLLGEYIGRVYLETKQRPIYLVRRSYRAGDDSQPDTGEDAR
jgi:polyisoprenyl-phosphate glycosyltransferase